MIDNIKNVMDRIPFIIKTIVNKLFGSQSMNLKFFIQQYDEDYKMKQKITKNNQFDFY